MADCQACNARLHLGATVWLRLRRAAFESHSFVTTDWTNMGLNNHGSIGQDFALGGFGGLGGLSLRTRAFAFILCMWKQSVPCW